MVQSQGQRTFDPYRILQLQPHASHALIIESYWTLVGRAKEHQNDAAIRALNAAYELLTNTDRRSAYDAERGYLPAPAAEKPSKSNGHHAAPQDHYTLLAVAREADRDIIEIAFRTATRRAAGHQPELVRQRDVLTEAYRTLTNAERRAQYDATLNVIDEPPAGAQADTQNGTGETANGAAAAPGFRSSKNKPRGEPDDPTGKAKSRGVFGRFGRRAAEPPAPAKTTNGATPAPSRTDESARGDRLLELRQFGADVLAGSMRRTPEAEKPPMAVLAISGPQGDERVPLPPRPISIGSSEESDIVLPGKRVALEHVRLWPHGDTFAMRMTEGAPVRVGGVTPVLAVVMLEDGDQIDLGDYRMTFHNAPRA